MVTVSSPADRRCMALVIDTIGREMPTDPPEGVNYDLWLGPAPEHVFTKNRWHYNWHWFWDYGCGDIGNDGIHQIDQARWGLGGGVPKAVVAQYQRLLYAPPEKRESIRDAIRGIGSTGSGADGGEAGLCGFL